MVRLLKKLTWVVVGQLLEETLLPFVTINPRSPKTIF